jgi:hypothetical protein
VWALRDDLDAVEKTKIYAGDRNRFPRRVTGYSDRGFFVVFLSTRRDIP